MHLDSEKVERLLAGELAAGAAEPTRTHLVECAECRGTVGEAVHADARVLALLKALDHPVPSELNLEATLARARRKSPARLRWAAGLLLAIGVAGVAWAAPGSPLPAWIAALRSVVARPATAPVPNSPPAEAAAPATAGIAVNPGAALTIAFEAPWPDGVAVVSLTGGADVVVRAPSGLAAFATSLGRVVVSGRPSAARFDIAIPTSAPRVEILVGGQRVLLVQASQASGLAAAGPPWTIPLSP